MYPRTLLPIALLVIQGVVASVCLADNDDKVENPAYTTWSTFKPQTSVKYKNTNIVKVMGNEVKSETDMTMTLLEVTKDKVVVEYGSVTKLMGQEYKAAATRQEYPHLIALKPGQQKEDVGKPDGVFEEGSERIKVTAGEFEAKWHKSKVENRILQSWVSEKIPGSLVKSVTTIGKEKSGINVMELVEIKKP